MYTIRHITINNIENVVRLILSWNCPIEFPSYAIGYPRHTASKSVYTAFSLCCTVHTRAHKLMTKPIRSLQNLLGGSNKANASMRIHLMDLSYTNGGLLTRDAVQSALCYGDCQNNVYMSVHRGELNISPRFSPTLLRGTKASHNIRQFIKIGVTGQPMSV